MEQTPEQWIEEWLLLWPADVKSGGETVRTPAKHCINKMVKWCKQYPQYDKSAIFAATKAYLADRKAENYFGIRRATYFIDKLGIGSGLAAWCVQLAKPLQIDEVPEYQPINDFI